MLYVSLGAWCQVAQQLKTHRPDQFVSSAFDWIVCPLKSVTKIFDTKGESFCEGLFLSQPSNSIECETYGILYHHDFPRNEKNEAFIAEGAPENAKSKLTHKHKSMCAKLEQSQEPVTFVRFGGHALPPVAWPYAKDKQPLLASELNEMAESIEKAFPDLVFRIVFIKCPTAHLFSIEESGLDSRIWPITMPHRLKTTWMGDAADWKVVLDMIPDAFQAVGDAGVSNDYPFAMLQKSLDALAVEVPSPSI